MTTHADRIASVDQVAHVGRTGLDLRVRDGVELRLHPERGLDIGGAWFRGTPLAWISPAGEAGAESDDWRSAWGGGLVTTCGPDNVGAPSEGLGLHGSWLFLRATDVETHASTDGIECRGTVRDPRGIVVERRLRTAVGTGRVELEDHAVNSASTPLEAPLLYHVNLGWPLWDEGATVTSDADVVVPRDDDAAPHDPAIAPAPTEAPERVWEHLGATTATVANGHLGLRLTVTSSLPRLWQWVDPRPGYYAFALEPANCSVLGRAHDRAEGRLPVLAPGEERVTTLTITVEER